MKATVQLLLLSVPHTREYHGSKGLLSCINPDCEFNGGTEKHTFTIKERLHKIIFSRNYLETKRRKRVLKYV